ncbi:membrane-targeted effector domain-containing toxin [Pseudomonas zeae]|uniref:Membrane-targeted effector domain-containing toxin n=1 Tax=Pseudomonas zeae TaxID=2745510 RepID=A0A9E6NN72_9PSED|nr:membrane-targeted effector domain-containing toxin [Pseudomonas zeae]QXI10876.1 membrane-targeted effector domain-containing toxin [Pseudomonas zeae]
MTSPERRLLPNAADKTALKAIAATIVQTCPSLLDAAHQVANEILADNGLSGLDSDRVYFHRFKTAQSSTLTFTGWEHLLEKPYETLTLTQLVIHRFRATDQDNADLLGLYCGFYSDGPEAENFNQSNEVRLLGSDVLKAFWDVDFSARYIGQLTTFWQTSSDNFRALAKCNFLSLAVQALQQGDLDGTDFQRVVDSVIGPVTWPVTLPMLQALHPVGAEVRALDLDGHVASNALRLVEDSGRQTLYLPGESQTFLLMENEADLHWWMLEQMNSEDKRTAFLKHFPLADRNHLTENLTDLMNRLVSTWGHSDHQMINRSNVAISGDAFTWLSESTRTAMVAEAHLVLTSNSQLRKKLWIGYLSAGLKVFGPMAAVGWPLALPLIGASIANMGLNIDQAINGTTPTERKAGVTGAVLNAIDIVFNIPFLISTGAQLEVGPQVEFAEAQEMLGLVEFTAPDVPFLPPVDQPPVATIDPQATVELANEIATGTTIASTRQLATPAARQGWSVPKIPAKYRCNELLAQRSAEAAPGKYEGIYRLDKEPGYAIEMEGAAYYVRYFADSEDTGHWAIVNPERPNQFAYSLPVRLSSSGKWERIPALRLRGGGQCLGKACLLGIDLPSSSSSAPASSTPSAELPLVEPVSPVARPLRLVTPLNDIVGMDIAKMKRWAMNLPETFDELSSANRGHPSTAETYEAYFRDRRTSLLNKAKEYYSEMKWTNLPARPVIPKIDPEMQTAELIDRIFANTDGLVVGETLDRIASMRFMIENMPAFARHIDTLYVRGLLNDFAQADLNDFYLSGEMSEDLRGYLSGLSTDPDDRFNMLELIKAAQANGIRSHGLEVAHSYKLKIPLTSIEEQMIHARLASKIMWGDELLNRPGKWVALVEATNTNAFRNLPGISELRGGIGLRIEEAVPSEVPGVSIDPGLKVTRGPFDNGATTRNSSDILFADLRLQIETPVPQWTEATENTLLNRNGMFILKKMQNTYMLVRRDSSSNIVRTVVNCRNGQFYIWAQSMPRISGIMFRNLGALSQRLIEIGLTLQSRLPN